MLTESIEMQSGAILHSTDHEETAVAYGDAENQDIPGISICADTYTAIT